MFKAVFPALVALVGLTVIPWNAMADRTPSIRSVGMRSTGARADITVPYLTTGQTAFGGYRVAPRIYSDPIVNDRANPGIRPVYNLIFYGAQQGYSGRSVGATPKPE